MEITVATDADRLDAVVASCAAGYQARDLAAPDHPRRAGSAAARDTASTDGPGVVAALVEHTRPATFDLIITAAAPGEVDDGRAHRATLFAARALRAGGLLAVLTHSDWTGGVLHDPTGVVVTAGQNADLLYLQHIVAIHRPLTGASVRSTPLDQPPAADEHRRVHSDVLVLVQPHDHALDLPNAAAA